MITGFETHKWRVDLRRDLVIYWWSLGWFTLFFGRGTLSGRLQKLADALSRVVDPGEDE